MIGKTLAHYRITELIGKGGMGDVYRAEDTKLGRSVALKVLSARMSADADQLSRLIREAKTIAGLNHPNIVTLHSVDEAEGIHFLTMELVEGRPLNELLTGDGLPLDQLLGLAIAITEAVVAAHAEGVIHRDLKPGNVMVSTDGMRVKVLDFGLARAMHPGAGTSSEHLDALTVTTAGASAGTPLYMSPEQIRGVELDGRSDIFSLGILLHEMATGERPFVAASAAELFSAVLRDEPPSMAARRPELPEAFEGVVRRCLAKSPEDRYPAAQDLLDDLIALRDGSSPVNAPGGHTMTAAHSSPAGPGRRTRRMSRRVWATVAAVVAVAAAATVAVWFAPDRGQPAPVSSERSILAVLPFVNLGSEEDEYFAVGIADEIRSRLAVIGQLGVISRTSMRAYENTRKTIREIGRELGTDYVLEGTIQWDRSQDPGRVRINPRLVRVADDIQLWSGGYERELTEIFALQADIAARIAEALDLTLAQAEHRALSRRPTENIAAYQAYLQGMIQLNAPGFSRESFALGVQMFEKAVALDPGFALAEARLASMIARTYHYGFDRSDERRRRALAAAERALALQSDLPAAHLALGHYYYWCERDYDRALDALARARSLDTDSSEIMLAQAYVKRRQGDFEATVELFEQERVLNPRDPNAVVGLGETFATLRRYADAERAFLRAIDLAPGDPYPYTELALVNLRWRGDTEAARRILGSMPPADSSESCRVGFLVELLARNYHAALQQLQTCPGDVMEAGAFYRPAALDVGMTRLLMGQPDAARESFAAARDILANKLAETPDDPRLHAALGLVLAGLGEDAQAVQHGRRAVDLNPLSRDALEAPVQIIDFARILAMTGAHAEAVAQLDRALSIPSILSTAWLETDPRWDALRGEAAFAQLLADHRDAGRVTP